jgi:hypothetical protein
MIPSLVSGKAKVEPAPTRQQEKMRGHGDEGKAGEISNITDPPRWVQLSTVLVLLRDVRAWGETRNKAEPREW